MKLSLIDEPTFAIRSLQVMSDMPSAHLGRPSADPNAGDVRICFKSLPSYVHHPYPPRMPQLPAQEVPP